MLLAHGMELFGQQRNNFGGNGGAAAGAGGVDIGIILCFWGLAFLVGITIQCLFLNSLSKCLKQIAPRNRTMEPGQVWLNLIPLFNYVWMFITIIRLSESLDAEYRSRRMSGDGDFGKQTGIIFMVLSLIGCGCIGFIFLIMYWVKIAGFTKELQSSARPRDEEFEDDDRPRRRPRDEDDRDRNDDDDYRPRDRR